MQLYVTVSDGKLTAKSEVIVNIVNGTTPRAGSSAIGPTFLQIPSIGHRTPAFPPNFPHVPPSTQHKTYLQPVVLSPVTNRSPDDRRTTAAPKKDGTDTNSVEDGSTELPVKSPPELSASIVPVISVCAIFLAVAVIALLFKNKIYFNRNKNTKDEMVCYLYLNYILVSFNL